MNALPLRQRVAQWIESQKLFAPSERILLAISGGKDSVALAYLLHDLNYDFGLAHMNFQLRGDDSDGDEAFVKGLAGTLKVAYHVRRVDTKGVARRGESTQMAARRLRYEWFDEVCTNEGYGSIATAHSANDNAETLLFNLVQGTGLKGLVGIPPINGNIKRPLLCLSSEEVLSYLQEQGHSHRDDQSNATDHYKRNYIRHHVLPPLKEVNSQAIANLSAHSDRFRRISGYYHEKLEADKRRYWSPTTGGNWQLVLSDFLQETHALNLLIEWLRPLLFSPDALASFLESHTGAQLFSSHQAFVLVKDRDQLLLMETGTAPIVEQTIKVDSNGSLVLSMTTLQWEWITSVKGQDLRAPQCAYLDGDKLSGTTLHLRAVQEGDRFQPFGMKGSQLISDFAVNNKLSFEKKERLMVLNDANNIAWLIGHRTSDLYKIGRSTPRILKLTWSKKTKSPFPFVENI